MKVSSLFYRRNYNIESLSVSQTNTVGISRFTIMIDADEWAHEQVEKQLAKLVEVISVENLSHGGPFIERCFSLIKVKAAMEARPHIFRIADVFRCHVVDMGSDALTLEVTGNEGKIRACIEALQVYGIIETAGSGSVALGRVQNDSVRLAQDSQEVCSYAVNA
jgi:acetolactate synthase-1/3 small subunit